MERFMFDEIQRWYQEAVAVYGDDWPNIERYVHQKVSHLSQVDRARLMHEFLAMQSQDTGPPN
jgi:hypothetical protein